MSNWLSTDIFTNFIFSLPNEKKKKKKKLWEKNYVPAFMSSCLLFSWFIFFFLSEDFCIHSSHLLLFRLRVFFFFFFYHCVFHLHFFRNHSFSNFSRIIMSLYFPSCHLMFSCPLSSVCSFLCFVISSVTYCLTKPEIWGVWIVVTTFAIQKFLYFSKENFRFVHFFLSNY